MQIIDGYCDVPNIYADDIGEYNISLFGAGDYVLAVGEKLGYELISNNELRIKDGIFLTQGRRGIIKKGSSELCIIENGTQAEKRNDLVVIEYARDEATQVESHRLKVLKGTPGEDAADPEAVTGDISSGAVLHQMPLYRVRLDGLNVVAVEPLFEIGNVSPETVDPVTATEEGFAADAKLTGDALRDLSANLYPVGAVYMSFDSTDPADLFGGTWERIEGRFLLGASDGYPVDSTGGSTSGSVNIPATAYKDGTWGLYSKSAPNGDWVQWGSTVARMGVYSVSTMPPYLSIYMWRRVG